MLRSDSMHRACVALIPSRKKIKFSVLAYTQPGDSIWLCVHSKENVRIELHTQEGQYPTWVSDETSWEHLTKGEGGASVIRYSYSRATSDGKRVVEEQLRTLKLRDSPAFGEQHDGFFRDPSLQCSSSLPFLHSYVLEDHYNATNTQLTAQLQQTQSDLRELRLELTALSRASTAQDHFEEVRREVAVLRKELLDFREMADRETKICRQDISKATTQQQLEGVRSEVGVLRQEFSDFRASAERDLRSLRRDMMDLQEYLEHVTSRIQTSNAEIGQTAQAKAMQDTSVSASTDGRFYAIPDLKGLEPATRLSAQPNVSADPHVAVAKVAHAQLDQKVISPLGFSTPPYPSDALRIALEVEREVADALKRHASSEEKRVLWRKMLLKVHPDKGGTKAAWEWLKKWEETRLKWFLGDGYYDYHEES
eukprot:TRINITY_DN106075_c0_g1_i1.p1 TRINITY_DN106075_c0_g1~~TRINITY_DN106075_c0_g1_i1.p1  ORF type:complete len:423 (+),score=69.29 TRINITY_DN106075_c0_g1_i1:191-1459(+)